MGAPWKVPLRPIPAKEERGWGNTPKRRMRFPCANYIRPHQPRGSRGRIPTPLSPHLQARKLRGAPATTIDSSSALPTCLPRTTSTQLASFIPNEHTPSTYRLGHLAHRAWFRAPSTAPTHQEHWSGKPGDASTSSPFGDPRTNKSCAWKHDRNGRQGRLPGRSGPASRRREGG